MPARRPSRDPARASKTAPTAKNDLSIDLLRYTPALFTSITYKLNSGASSQYLANFGIGIEVWRVLAMVAREGRVTAQRICQFTGMDKGSVSRTFKAMEDKGLIRFSLDEQDKRLKYAEFTPRGRKLHDLIHDFALAREQALLSVLSRGEAELFIELLRRVRENLPNVDAASEAYVAEHWRGRKLL